MKKKTNLNRKKVNLKKSSRKEDFGRKKNVIQEAFFSISNIKKCLIFKAYPVINFFFRYKFALPFLQVVSWSLTECDLSLALSNEKNIISKFNI